MGFQNIRDTCLIDIYVQALELGCDQAFIEIIEKERERRFLDK